MLRIVVLFLALGVAGLAYSADPAAVPFKRPQEPQVQSQKSQQTTFQEKRGTHQSPLVIEILPAKDADEKTRHERESENKKVFNDTIMAGATVALAVITSFLAIFTWKLWRATGKLVESGENTARTELRAYVKMFHLAPGLEVERPSGLFTMTVKIKNFGRTPAKVTDILLRPRILANGELLPEIPDYSRAREQKSLHAFLVTEEDFIYNNPEAFSMGEQNVPDVDNGTKKLYVFGYVDYIDAFEQRHRAGYAMVYKPPGPSRVEFFGGRDNLVLVTQEGYNYDRLRKEGEGNDWN